jgi:hypothetical protein
MHVRQIAWLNAIPEKAEGGRAKSAEATKSRWDDMRTRGIEPALPECDTMHLVHFLLEIGPDHASGPIPHSEIESWQRNTGMTLNPWEARTLRRLSSDYLGQSYRSRDPNCPAPDDEVREQSRELGNRKFAEAMANRFGRSKK